MVGDLPDFTCPRGPVRMVRVNERSETLAHPKTGQTVEGWSFTEVAAPDHNVVCSGGWTAPAEIEHYTLDLRFCDVDTWNGGWAGDINWGQMLFPRWTAFERLLSDMPRRLRNAWEALRHG